MSKRKAENQKHKKSKKEKSDSAASSAASSATTAGVSAAAPPHTEPPQTIIISAKEKEEFLTLNSIKLSLISGVSSSSGGKNDEFLQSINPILSFTSVQNKLTSDINENLKKFEKPTPIQSISWPLLLDGKDLVGVAKTGSGKTMAFGVPALVHLQKKLGKSSSSSKRPRILVLSPTRELAMQIEEQFILFANSASCRTVCIYGGVAKQPQQEKLRKGMDVIIATPGRLIDLFEQDDQLCDLSKVSYLVLDEADRMLDAGFEDAIKKIINKLPTKRQTVMFSATWPNSIQKMASNYLTNPVKVTVGSTDLSANSSIEQRVEVLEPTQKESRLLSLLKDYHKSRKNRILIFALYKKEAARLEQFLKRQGYKCGAIHGDLGQDQRTRALDAFKDASAPLLIATDVAARGIDIPNVEYVINVTFPLTVEDYCHRIGRTGRAGNTGISHTFFTIHDKTHSGSLINVLKQAGQPVPPELMKFGTTVKKKVDPIYGAFAKDVDMSLKPTKMTFDSDSD